MTSIDLCRDKLTNNWCITSMIQVWKLRIAQHSLYESFLSSFGKDFLYRAVSENQLYNKRECLLKNVYFLKLSL